MRKIYTAIAATVSRISDPIKKKPRNGRTSGEWHTIEQGPFDRLRMKTVHKKEDNLFPAGNQQLNKLIARLHGIKHRCGRDRHYLRVTFKFESAREAAEYMLAVCGPLPEPAEGTNLSIDRIDGRRGYERGNLR